MAARTTMPYTAKISVHGLGHRVKTIRVTHACVPRDSLHGVTQSSLLVGKPLSHSSSWSVCSIHFNHFESFRQLIITCTTPSTCWFHSNTISTQMMSLPIQITGTCNHDTLFHGIKLRLLRKFFWKFLATRSQWFDISNAVLFIAPGLDTNLEILGVCHDSYCQDRKCCWVGSVRHKIGSRVC